MMSDLRMALGAMGGKVLRQALREGLALSLPGVGPGWAGNLILSRALLTLRS